MSYHLKVSRAYQKQIFVMIYKVFFFNLALQLLMCAITDKFSTTSPSYNTFCYPVWIPLFPIKVLITVTAVSNAVIIFFRLNSSQIYYTLQSLQLFYSNYNSGKCNEKLCFSRYCRYKTRDSLYCYSEQKGLKNKSSFMIDRVLSVSREVCNINNYFTTTLSHFIMRTIIIICMQVIIAKISIYKLASN